MKRELFTMLFVVFITSCASQSETPTTEDEAALGTPAPRRCTRTCGAPGRTSATGTGYGDSDNRAGHEAGTDCERKLDVASTWMSAPKCYANTGGGRQRPTPTP